MRWSQSRPRPAHQRIAEESPRGTTQQPQCRVMGPKGPPSNRLAWDDLAMGPETRDLRAHHPPAEAQRSHGAQAPPSSIPENSALDTEEHQRTGGQRHQPRAGGVTGRG
ncbi:hypothetical protein CRENBAI_014410 [Crenichthys baileyi]|uniref:Uncharacterized protein n=1 Tax=Crenichthys baileyi TaxID=28760 RepID=A0AAV9RJQ4_9TELE